MLAEAPRPVVSPSSGLYPEYDGGHLGEKEHEGTPWYALPQHDVTGIIEAYDMRCLPGHGNAEDAKVWHGTCPLSVNGSLWYRDHSGSSTPHWKEARPLH